MYELLFFISFPLKKEEWKLVESKHLQNMIKNIKISLKLELVLPSHMIVTEALVELANSTSTSTIKLMNMVLKVIGKKHFSNIFCETDFQLGH